MRKKKVFVLVILVFVLSAGWLWRFTALNRLFQENYLPHYVEYSMGEDVAFGENRLLYSLSCDGYAVNAQKREIFLFEDYAEKYGFSPQSYSRRMGGIAAPDAVVEVTVVLKNEADTGAESRIPLSCFYIYSDSWSASVDGGLFLYSNPGWDPAAVNLYLDPGEEVTVVLPFSVRTAVMPKHVWNQFEKTDMRLLVALYPENIAVRLNG